MKCARSGASGASRTKGLFSRSFGVQKNIKVNKLQKSVSVNSMDKTQHLSSPILPMLDDARCPLMINYSRRFLHWAPLLALPLMLNLHWSAMIAPNEEPKWAVLIVLGLGLGLAASVHWASLCRGGSGKIAAERPGCGAAGLGLAVFVIGLAAGVTYAVNPWEGWNRFVFWAAAGLTWWASVRTARAESVYEQHLQIALAVAALLFSGQFWYMYFVDYSTPGYNMELRFSPIGHVNFTADVLVVLIPLLMWAMLRDGYWGVRIAAGVSLISCIMMLLIGASRGGVGGILLGAVAALTIFLIRGRGKSCARSFRRPSLALFLGLSVMACISLLHVHLPYKFREIARLSASSLENWRTEGWAFVRSFKAIQAPQPPLPPLVPLWQRTAPWLWKRTPMWAATSGMIADAPWLGHGTGNYLFVYPDYSNRYPSFRDPLSQSRSVTTNPHNVLLQIASENGIPMAVLFAGLYAWLLWRLVLQAWKEPRVLWLCGVWAAVAVAFDAQFNHVFFNPASLFLCAVGLGAVYGFMPGTEGRFAPSLCRFWRWPMALGLAWVLLLAAAAVPLGWLVSEYHVAEAQRLEAENRPELLPAVGGQYEAALPWSPYNFRALYGAAVSAFKARRLAESENLIRKFLKVFPHHMNGLNLLGAILLETNRPAEAEAAFSEALRLYPDSAMVRQNLARAVRRRYQP
jgi:hypothetical protein